MHHFTQAAALRSLTWRIGLLVVAGILAAPSRGAAAGHTDWRLPTVRELQTLVDYGAVEPSVSSAFDSGCVPGCAASTCSCTDPVYYWSATLEVPRRGGHSYAAAWFVSFIDGVVYSNFETNSYGVRAVRTAP